MLLWLFTMVLFYTFQSLFCRIYTSSRNGGGAIQFSVFYAAFAGVATLAINGFSYTFSPATLITGLLNALVLLTYNIAMVKCGVLGSYAFMMLCALSGGILVPMAYDALYLGYSFSTIQLIALAMILAAFVILNLDGIKAKKNLKYLIWCAVLFITNGLYTILMNLQQTLTNFTLRNEMVITTFLGMAVMTSAFYLLFSRKSFIDGWRMEKKSFLPMFISSLSSAIAVTMFMYSMKTFNITVLAVVNNGGVLVLSAIAAFTLFKEKLTASSVIGMVLATASIIMLSL